MDRMSVKRYLFLLISILGYSLFAFYIQRPDTINLFIAYSFLFLAYWQICKSDNKREIQFWLAAGIFFRIIFLLSIPNLSDDFYRFIWDGRLLANGLHPFSHLPSYYIENKIAIEGIDQHLFEKLNSQNYFTIYPPVNQFIFFLAAKVAGNSIMGSIVMMRLFIIASEIGSFMVIKKLLLHYKLPEKNILLYVLNPLVIIELTGNLHFEALMIFFLLWGIWLLIQHKNLISALSFSLAICSKLLPIIILPLLFARLGFKRFLIYGSLVLMFCIFAFLPLLNADIILGFRQSLGYYFTKFEFNASIYYLVREWGFWKYGYNIIQTVGWKLGAWSFSFMLLYILYDAFRKFKVTDSSAKIFWQYTSLWNLDGRIWTSFLFVFLIHFSFATVMHPWYVATLVVFSIFTRFRFPVLWSALIFLTYTGYSSEGFTENIWVVVAEYAMVFGYLAVDLLWKQKKHLS